MSGAKPEASSVTQAERRASSVWVTRGLWAGIILGLAGAVAVVAASAWLALGIGSSDTTAAGPDPITDVTTYDIDDNGDAEFVEINEQVRSVPNTSGSGELLSVVVGGSFVLVGGVIAGICSIIATRRNEMVDDLRDQLVEQRLDQLEHAAS